MFFFHVLTFGCKVNQYESQAQREAWTALGGIECEKPEDADIILLATCAVTAEAVSDARQAARKLARIAPDARLAVTGCQCRAGGFSSAVAGGAGSSKLERAASQKGPSGAADGCLSVRMSGKNFFRTSSLSGISYYFISAGPPCTQSSGRLFPLLYILHRAHHPRALVQQGTRRGSG